MAGITETLGAFKGGAASLAQYSWVLWIFIPIAILIFVGFMWKMYSQKKKQWTHKLRIRRVLQSGYLSKGEQIIKMRRFPLIRTGEVFELETPLLGSYLIPELDAYTGDNEYSIILDTNNRIYTNTGEKFIPDKQSVNVSAKHSEIDLAMGDFKKNYQEVHKVTKRVEWAAIAKFAMLGLLIIAVMVVSIKGIDKWGENHNADAQKATAEAETYRQLNEVLKTVEAVVGVQLVLVDEIKELKGTDNIQGIIREARNETL